MTPTSRTTYFANEKVGFRAILSLAQSHVPSQHGFQTLGLLGSQTTVFPLQEVAARPGPSGGGQP